MKNIDIIFITFIGLLKMQYQIPLTRPPLSQTVIFSIIGAIPTV